MTPKDAEKFVEPISEATVVITVVVVVRAVLNIYQCKLLVKDDGFYGKLARWEKGKNDQLFNP